MLQRGKGAVLRPRELDGGQAGCLGGIQLRFHIGEEQHFARRQADRARDVAVAGGFALGARPRVEKPAEQASQIAGIRVAENQPLRSFRAG